VLKSEARTCETPVMGAEEWALVGNIINVLINRNKDYE
jgi:hypothetical protein